MNKKFSTLLATLLVAGGMSSASAAVTVSSPVLDVKTVESGKFYQLTGSSSDGQVLVMVKEGEVYKVKKSNLNAVPS